MGQITDSQAHSNLRRYYQSIYEAVDFGYNEYMQGPFVGIHCPRTVANNLNDHVWAQLVNRLDGVPGIAPVFDRRRNLRFLRVDAPRPLLLWLKKVDIGRHHAVYPTRHAAEVLESGQSELLPRAAMLVLGFTPKRDRLGIMRVSINPPCPPKVRRPEWFIDILPVPVAQLGLADAQVRIRIQRSSQLRLAP